MANYGNTASVAQLSAPITSGATTCTVSGFTGFPPTPFWAEIARGTASAEMVNVTNVSGSTLTISRGQDGTVASSHGAGDNLEHVAPAAVFNASDAHIAASTNVHGLSGGASVVGTTGGQTVQDKTFRGAHVSQYSDALPAGVTASYLSTADSAAARDGFVHNATAADVDRRGLLISQSGTPRVQAFNDGTVDVAPSGAAARPGIRNHGSTQLDGTLSVAGAVTASTTAAVTGAATVGGTLGVTGAATVGGTLVVTGDVTGKTVTTPVPIIGDNADRVTVNGRVGAGAAVRVKNESGTVTASIHPNGNQSIAGDFAAANVNSSLGLTAWGGQAAVLSVPTTGTVTSPVTGMVVFDQSLGVFKRWTGSAWVDATVPKGVVARGSRTTSTSAAASITFVPDLRVDAVALKAGRLYKIETNNIQVDSTVNGDNIRALMFFNTAGNATIASTVLPGAQANVDATAGSGAGGTVQISTALAPGADATYSFLLAHARIAGTGNTILVGNSDLPIQIIVTDLGAAPSDTGVSL